MFGATWGVVEVANPNLKLVEPLSMTNGVCAVRCESYDRVGGIDGCEGSGRAKTARGVSGVDVIKPLTQRSTHHGYMAAYPARRRSVGNPRLRFCCFSVHRRHRHWQLRASSLATFLYHNVVVPALKE